MLYDGWHRVTARRRIDREHPGRGYDELAAEIVRADDRDAVEYAYELAIDCSAIGSKQLTQSERIAATKRLSEVRPDLPAREVARRLGISHPTVLRARGSAAVTGGGTRLPIANDVAQPAGETVAKTPKADRTVTLEQRAWRMADALRQLLDQSRAETRGMLGFGKPNLTRAGAAAYTALERSCGEDAPALAEDLFVLAAAVRDQARKA